MFWIILSFPYLLLQAFDFVFLGVELFMLFSYRVQKVFDSFLLSVDHILPEKKFNSYFKGFTSL